LYHFLKNAALGNDPFAAFLADFGSKVSFSFALHSKYHIFEFDKAYIYMKNIKNRNLTVGEPAIQYHPGTPTPEIMPMSPNTNDQFEFNRDEYMTVTEYFDKVRKALDLKYENIQGNNQ